MTTMTTGTRTGFARPGLALLLVAASLLGLVAVYWFFVLTTVGQSVDGNNVIADRVLPTTLLHGLDRLLDLITTETSGAALLVLVAIALLRRQPRTALAVVALVLGANLTTQLLKMALDRPSLLKFGVLGYLASGNTLPSGHVTLAFSLGLGLTLVVPPAYRSVAAAAGVLFASAIAVAVITSGWHHPSDAVAAVLAASAWGAIALLAWGGDRRGQSSPVAPDSSRRLLDRLWNRLPGGLMGVGVGLALLATIGLTWFAGRVADVGGVGPLVRTSPYAEVTFASGILLALGSVLLFFGLLLALLRTADRAR